MFFRENGTMQRNFGCTLLVLIITATFCETSNEDEGDADYDKIFYTYNENDEWIQTSDEQSEWGPLNIRGKVRKRFAMDAALFNPQKSMICSPISALLPLGKLAIGAEGDCLKQLLSAIGLNKKAELTKGFKPLLKSLEYMAGVKLSIVSKIYVSNNVELKSKFTKRAKSIFKSTVESVDFQQPSKVARLINDYVREKTNRMIQFLINPSEISPQSSLIIVNAVYFSGTWEYKFDKTHVDSFFTPAATRKIPMMTREGNYKYSKNPQLDAQLVEIPYTGGQASFVIILPNTKEGLPVLLHKIRLAPELLQQALSKMQLLDIILTIPKFKTEAQIDMKTSYEMMGLTEIFQTKKSGLEGIIKNGENIHVSKAVQRAVIEVHEEGTQAAAASELIAMAAVPFNKKVILSANRPFMYYIRYNKEIIFAGVYIGD